jgi:FO synthase
MATPAQTSRALARARRGASLDVGEAAALLAARGEALADLQHLAAAARDRRLLDEGRPGVVTYSPKVFIPLTRLCRDRCHYCTFATTPGHLARAGEQPYLTLEEVRRIARQGAAAGCYEALLTLGDRPEDRWPQARQWLDEAGYASTLDYLRAAAITILEDSGLLPHLNPGVLSWQELRRLRPVAPSMGMMLETTSRRLYEQPGQVHFGSPDKDPEVRLRVLHDAGRQSVPFTTGVLVGIGETDAELADSLLQIASIAKQYGHVQEVIVQNFRAKPGTAARDRADESLDRQLAALAVARLVLPAAVSLQAPPNLHEPAELGRLLAAGVDDWGGVSPVTPDHVNPERPWPPAAALAEATAAAGFTLKPRLTAHPRYVRRGASWLDPRLIPHTSALAAADGLAAPAAAPVGRPWQADEDAGGYRAFAAAHAGGRVDLHRVIDLVGRQAQTRGDIDEVYGDWDEVLAAAGRTGGPAGRADAALLAAGLRRAAAAPATLADPQHAAEALALMSATGEPLRDLCAIADDLRRTTVGDDVTFVVNRNINFTNVCYTGCRFCAFAQRESDADAYTLSIDEVVARAREARAAGATEICLQGGIHPRLPGDAYFDLLRAIKAAEPDLHLHAFSPMEVVNGATRLGVSVREWLVQAKDAGLGSIPGTAAEILDDEVRWILTKGKLPTAAWIDVVTTAHSIGLPSTATMMYGHVDRPVHWVAHLRTLRGIGERTGGFTEFVPLPFIHHNAPLYLSGAARPGPTAAQNLAVHAMARLLLHGVVDNIQCSWVKLGDAGSAAMLVAGVNDLGGTLMEETISRMAGSEHGSAKTPEDLVAIAALAGRPARERTTLYQAPAPPSPLRMAAAAPTG